MVFVSPLTPIIWRVGPAFHYASLTCHCNTVPCRGNAVAPSHCMAGLTRVSLVPYRLGFDPLSSEYITKILYFVGTNKRFDGIDFQSRSAQPPDNLP